MVALLIDGDELVVELTGLEKVEAVHGDVRVPLAAVDGVEVVGDAFAGVHGIRAPGTGVPGVLMVGTTIDEGVRSFVVVRHGRPRGLRVRLRGERFDQLLLGLDDPDTAAAALATARG